MTTTEDEVRPRLEARLQERLHEQAAAGTGRHRQPERPQTWLRMVIRTAIILVAAAAVAFGLRGWVGQPVWIPFQSIEAPLHGCPGCNPDRLLVDKLSYHLHSVHRGDVVVFTRPPAAPSTDADLV